VLYWGRGQKYEKKVQKRQAMGLSPPVLDADGLVSGTGVGADIFCLFLQENCVDMFSDMDDLGQALHCLSDADITTNHMRV